MGLVLNYVHYYCVEPVPEGHFGCLIYLYLYCRELGPGLAKLGHDLDPEWSLHGQGDQADLYSYGVDGQDLQWGEGEGEWGPKGCLPGQAL